VGSEDGFRDGEHMAGKLKPLDVVRAYLLKDLSSEETLR
jgi:hypothetical protein